VGRRSIIKPSVRTCVRMFLGQFYHTLDEKGRLTMPSRFRDLLGSEGAYLMRGFDQNLMVVTASSFDVIYERVNRMSMTDPMARALRRLVFSAAVVAEFDKMGRILLPQYLREAAGIQAEAVVVGAGDYIEIWSPQGWNLQTAQLNDKDFTADRFAALGLAAG
jgi:MraZ protein